VYFALALPLRILIHRPHSEGGGRSSGVEHNLAKVGVVSSNLIARSIGSSAKGPHLAALFRFRQGPDSIPFLGHIMQSEQSG
jgi:hypothetical protein